MEANNTFQQVKLSIGPRAHSAKHVGPGHIIATYVWCGRGLELISNLVWLIVSVVLLGATCLAIRRGTIRLSAIQATL
jgi:hypothetical protein